MTSLPTLEEYLEKVLARAKRHYRQHIAPARMQEQRAAAKRALPDKKERSRDSYGICLDCGKPCAYLRCPSCHRKWRERRDYQNEQ